MAHLVSDYFLYRMFQNDIMLWYGFHALVMILQGFALSLVSCLVLKVMYHYII